MSAIDANKSESGDELSILAKQAGLTIPESSREAVLMHLGIAGRMHATLSEDSAYPELALAAVFKPLDSGEEKQ